MRAILSSMLAVGFALPVFADTYKIDPAHSEVGFKVRHLAISNVAGKFVDFSGTFSFDPKDVKSSKTEATISVPSITTSNNDRDKHLKGDDFFSADKFPGLKFASKSVTATTDSAFKVAGDLTIRDVTKPVVLDVTYNGSAKDPWGNERAAFSATTKISRADYGLTWNKALETGGVVVGDEVTILIEVEGTKVKG
jgi:polyisoprenoid-binding protein YceI